MTEEKANHVVSVPPFVGYSSRQWRETCQISLEQASELTGVGIDAIQAIENGGRCTQRDFQKYSDFLFDCLLKNENVIQDLNKEFLNILNKSNMINDDDFIEDVEWEEVE